MSTTVGGFAFGALLVLEVARVAERARDRRAGVVDREGRVQVARVAGHLGSEGEADGAGAVIELRGGVVSETIRRTEHRRIALDRDADEVAPRRVGDENLRVKKWGIRPRAVVADQSAEERPV